MKNLIFFFVTAFTLFLVACGAKTHEERVREMVEKINSSPEWKNDIAKKIQERNLTMSMDTAIYHDAVWTVDDLDGLHNK